MTVFQSSSSFALYVYVSVAPPWHEFVFARSHLRSLHVALLRRYRELLALQEKRQDEKDLEFFASRLGDSVIMEDEGTQGGQSLLLPTHTSAWWRVSPTELRKREFDVKEDLKRIRDQASVALR